LLAVASQLFYPLYGKQEGRWCFGVESPNAVVHVAAGIRDEVAYKASDDENAADAARPCV
jgi:hypothetical protein